jgi:hypothetical protein
MQYFGAEYRRYKRGTGSGCRELVKDYARGYGEHVVDGLENESADFIAFRPLPVPLNPTSWLNLREEMRDLPITSGSLMINVWVLGR